MPTARHKERQLRGKAQTWKMCWTAEKKYLWHCKQVPLEECALRRTCISIHASQTGALGSLPQGDSSKRTDWRVKADTREDLAAYPRGQYWVQYCSMPSLLTGWWGRVYPQSANDTKLAGVADALEGHPDRSWQDRGMGRQESHKVQQSPALGEEEHHAPAQCGRDGKSNFYKESDQALE